MKAIWKFTLDPGPDGRCTVWMPRVREHLSVGMQANAIVMWATVDSSQGHEEVTFAIAGTGWDAADGVHRGTVQTDHGFVWHVFEVSDGQ